MYVWLYTHDNCWEVRWIWGSESVPEVQVWQTVPHREQKVSILVVLSPFSHWCFFNLSTLNDGGCTSPPPPSPPPYFSFFQDTNSKAVPSLDSVKRELTYLYVRHDSFICITCLIHMSEKSQSYVWHDAFIRVTWLIICVTWLIHMCAMICCHEIFEVFSDPAYSYAWHDSFIWVTWLIYMCDMTYSHVWHDSFTCVTWLIRKCDMPQADVWHNMMSWHI